MTAYHTPSDPNRNRAQQEASANINAAAQQHRPSQSNFQPFQQPSFQQTYQPQQRGPGAVSVPQASSTPNTYYAGEGTRAAMDVAEACEGILLGSLGYKAGMNYHKMHPDGVDAAVYGAHAARRWLIWLIFVKIWLVWLVFTMWLFYLSNHKVQGESFPDNSGALEGYQKIGVIGLPIVFVLGIAVPYCRNVDFSLFKRRLFYKLFRPLVVILDRVPNGLLYLTFLGAFFIPVDLGHAPDEYQPFAGQPSAEAQPAAEAQGVDKATAVEEVCELINNAWVAATPDANGEVHLKLFLSDEQQRNANVTGSDLKSWYTDNC